MADARPSGSLTAGAVGCFILALSFVLFLVSGGGMSGGMSAGGMALIGVLLLFAGIPAAFGFFGMGKIYGGMNGLGGTFTLITGLVPILLLIVGILFASSGADAAMADISMGGSGAAAAASVQTTGTVAIIVALLPPALMGIIGGLGLMKASAPLAKPGGIALIAGGGGAALALLATVVMQSATLMEIGGYVMNIGLAAGCVLAGMTFLAEKTA